MASHPIYQFYIELDDYEPKMWRRFQLMNNVNIAKLGYVIMSIFEMEGRHLFNFEVPVLDNFKLLVGDNINLAENQEALKVLNQSGGIINIELSQNDPHYSDRFTLNALDITLAKVLTAPGEKIYFNYDYGDGWQFTLTLENVFIDKNLPGKSLPMLLSGEGFGIIEDCGGVEGLAEIARAFKDKGDGYEEYSEWLDIEELDLEEYNEERLSYKIKNFPKMFKEAYEYEETVLYDDDFLANAQNNTPPLTAVEMWNRISPDVKRLILNSTYCPKCSVTSITDYTANLDGHDLVLIGKCSKCNTDVKRVVDY